MTESHKIRFVRSEGVLLFKKEFFSGDSPFLCVSRERVVSDNQKAVKN